MKKILKNIQNYNGNTSLSDYCKISLTYFLEVFLYIYYIHQLRTKNVLFLKMNIYKYINIGKIFHLFSIINHFLNY